MIRRSLYSPINTNPTDNGDPLSTIKTLAGVATAMDMDDVAAMVASRSVDCTFMDETTRILTQHVYSAFPSPPPLPTSAAAAASSSLVGAAPNDGADRISFLPDDTLRGVVSPLPVKDAARTTALSRRWRGIWPSIPLALADAHGPPPRRRRAPRPRRAPIHITGASMPAHPAGVARRLHLLAARGVQELVFVNRPTAAGEQLEIISGGGLFSCTSLTRLHIGFWSIPDTSVLPPAAVFPCLRELGLGCVAADERDLAFLIERCPVLEKLIVVASCCAVPIRIRSGSLRCVQVCSSVVPEITVGHASVLERLLLWQVCGKSSGPVTLSTRIRIGYAPNLRFLGFLVPGMHQLQIGNTLIKAGTKACSSITVPSVRILAVQVKLGTHIKAMMLPSFLRCFPNTETLYVQSEDDDIIHPRGRGLASISGDGQLDLKFWEEADPIECVQRSIKKVILRDFRGRRSELDFLRFVAERAQVLEKMVVEMAHGFSPWDQVGAKLKTFMDAAKWANRCCTLTVSDNPFSEEKGTPWCYLRAFDRSIEDPFDASKCVDGKCQSN
ncbi:unnamed protein product [Urochloa decumbens]|uniref:F-box domain-containing protein n=1 Tax=Urochloa decumbens TaxID=240449 RepID=A0ABC9BVV3_9POAL